eukprot:gene4441-3240_t
MGISLALSERKRQPYNKFLFCLQDLLLCVQLPLFLLNYCSFRVLNSCFDYRRRVCSLRLLRKRHTEEGTLYIQCP